ATMSLASIMLMDSAFIQETEVEQWNRRQRKKNPRFNDFRVPLYTIEDAQDCIDQFISIGYEQWYHLDKNIQVFFRDAGHILGSASVTIKIKEGNEIRTIGFTGDIGRPNRPILKDPIPMPKVEYLICESTYGDKLHGNAPEEMDKFLRIIKKTCVEKRGKLIIPAFSIGRTQEIVYILDQMENEGVLPRIPIYVDSPLAVEATDVYRSHPECFDKDLHKYMLKDPNPFGFRNLKYVSSVEESKSLNSNNNPCIIISASGMGNAGRVKHHLYNNLSHTKNTVLIVGYCSPETPGGQLRAGKKSLRMFGEEVLVNADVEIMDSFSAHGDQKEMHDFILNQRDSVRTLFLVHGELETQKGFKKYLNENGFSDIEIPQEGQEYTLYR
ncbi:MAG TPA: MBL fold metallo-hydrolase, partial [Saprospiraceae bacterium]|nr:MBL fold metallo-hydrolase [Saprospiraceae bacterium]